MGGGRCCDLVPGGGEGGRCCDQVPGGGIVTRSQEGGGREVLSPGPGGREGGVVTRSLGGWGVGGEGGVVTRSQRGGRCCDQVPGGREVL